jgi:ribosomal-protein-alanine N-acetyltransferase
MGLKQTPTFYTDRLILREIGLADAEFYEKNFVCYEIISSLSRGVWPSPKGFVLEHIKTEIIPNQGNGEWAWGLFLKSNPEELIGSINLWREGKPGNRGFWLGKKYWGKGLMTEAVEPVVNYAFTNLNFEKLVLTNAKGNIRSRRFKENSAARLIRVEPTQYINPSYTEREVWELTREDWLRDISLSA